MQVCNMIAAIFVEFQIEKHGSLTDELKNMASFFKKKNCFRKFVHGTWGKGVWLAHVRLLLSTDE